MFDIRGKAREFLCGFYENDEADYDIDWRITEYSNVVETISFSDAIEKFEEDFKDLFDFAGHEIPLEKIYEGVCKIWIKHLVKF